MFKLTGIEGRYDVQRRMYVPPRGYRDWQDVVNRHGLVLKTSGLNTALLQIVNGEDEQFAGGGSWSDPRGADGSVGGLEDDGISPTTHDNNHVAQAVLSKHGTPALAHGMLGFHEGGRLVKRFCVLFQGSLEYWDSKQSAVNGLPRLGCIPVASMEGVDPTRDGRGFHLRMKKRNVWVVAGPPKVATWTEALRSVIVVDSPSPRIVGHTVVSPRLYPQTRWERGHPEAIHHANSNFVSRCHADMGTAIKQKNKFIVPLRSDVSPSSPVKDRIIVPQSPSHILEHRERARVVSDKITHVQSRSPARISRPACVSGGSRG